MTLRALIVDDEYPARMELRYRLGQHPDVEIIGEATNAREALRLIEALDYDVIFLDVEMPGLSGIELARQLKGRETMPKIVFVTAYEGYAVPAFEMRAVDYLLKPIEDGRLAETVQRLREGSNSGAAAGGASGQAETAQTRSGPGLSWVLTEKDGKNIPVALADIVYIFAEGDSVWVQTHGDRLLTRLTLQELTDRLPTEMFFRSHRSYLVNLNQVKEITPYFNGAYLLKLKDKGQSEVTVSRGNVKKLKELFSMT